MKIKTKEKNDIFPILLFIIILLNLIPVLLANINTKQMLGGNKLFVQLMFVIQTLSLIFFLLPRISFNKEKKRNFILLTSLYLILIVTQIFAYFFQSMNFQDIINIFSKFINILLLFILISDIKVSEKSIQIFMKSILALAVFACVWNIVFYNKEILNIFNLRNSYSVNIKSFFSNRNQFAEFLFISIIVNIIVINTNKNILYKLIFPILLINLFTTMSRTAICVTFIFLFLSIIFNKNMKTKIKVILALVILLIVTVILITSFFPEIYPKLYKLFIREDSLENAAGRTEIWKEGVNITLEKNIFTGIGRFRGVNYLETNGLPFNQFHNTYIEILVSGGILELAFVLYIYLYTIIRLNKMKKYPEYKRIFLAASIGYLIAIFFESFARFSVGYVDTINLIFFTTIPILISNMKNDEDTIEKINSIDRKE